MILKQAKEIAIKICYLLQPHCDKINICGSVRRKKEEVHDIEIILLPKTDTVITNLFGDTKQVRGEEFKGIIDKLGKIVKGNADGKMMQIELPERIMLDLFIPDSESSYGNIYLIRTGDWEFSKFFMGVVLRKKGYYSEDGHVKREDNNEIIPTPDEQTIFDLAGMKFIEPQDRNFSNLQKAFYK